MGYKYACKLCAKCCMKVRKYQMFQQAETFLTLCMTDKFPERSIIIAVQVQLHSYLTTSLGGGDWLYPLRYPLNRRLSGLESRFGLFWRRKKSLAPAGSRTLDRPAHSLITALTELSWLLLRLCCQYTHMDAVIVKGTLSLCPPLRHMGKWGYCSTHS